MRPVSDRFLATLAQVHEVSVSATLLPADGSAGIDLPILSGSVTLDGTAATRAGLSLDLALGDATLVPDSTDAPLAPYGNEIQVHRGITYPDGTTETVSLGIFRIDEVNSDRNDDLSVQVSGLDRSAAIIEAVFEAPGTIAAAADAADEIQALINEVVPDTTYASDWGDTTVTLPALSYEVGEDRWDFCRGLAEAAQASLFFDGDGVLCMRPIAVSAEAVYTVSEGVDGTLLEASKRWGREDACNRVYVTGENAGNDPVVGEKTDDVPTSPTYYGGPFGKVTFAYSSSYITTDAQAQAVATRILSQKLGTGQQISFGALVNPALEPFDVVGVRCADLGIGDAERTELHIIDQLSIPLTHDGEMTAETRLSRVVV